MSQKPTYERYLLGDPSRFDHRNTMFCRACWEKETIEQQQMQNSIAKEKMKKGVPGFSQEDFALRSASWFIEGKYHRSASFMGNSGLYSWNSQDSVSNSFYSDRIVELDLTEASRKVKHAAKLFGAVLAGTFFSTANIIMRIGVIEGNPTNGTAISVFIGTAVVFIATVIEGSLLDLVKMDIISYLYLGIGGLINFILGRALFFS